MSRPADLGIVKEGSYVMIDGEPCKTVEVEHSKPGKHGSAKVRLTAISLFTGSKKSFIGTVDSRIEIPMIDKRSGQILSTSGNNVQVMDLQTFEVFETPAPPAEEIGGAINAGSEVEYWTVLGKSKIMRLKGGT